MTVRVCCLACAVLSDETKEVSALTTLQDSACMHIIILNRGAELGDRRPTASLCVPD
jgi:hypothetical protein